MRSEGNRALVTRGKQASQPAHQQTFVPLMEVAGNTPGTLCDVVLNLLFLSLFLNRNPLLRQRGCFFLAVGQDGDLLVRFWEFRFFLMVQLLSAFFIAQ